MTTLKVWKSIDQKKKPLLQDNPMFSIPNSSKYYVDLFINPIRLKNKMGAMEINPLEKLQFGEKKSCCL